MEHSTTDHTTILQLLTSPVVFGKLQAMTEEEIAAIIAEESKKSGLKESYIKASLRMSLHHISQAISRKRVKAVPPATPTVLEPTPLEKSIAEKTHGKSKHSKDNQNSQG